MKSSKAVFAFILVLFFALWSVFPVSLNQLRIIADDGTFLGSFENEYSTKSIYNHNMVTMVLHTIPIQS